MQYDIDQAVVAQSSLNALDSIEPEILRLANLVETLPAGDKQRERYKRQASGYLELYRGLLAYVERTIDAEAAHAS